jgi:putative transposase
MESFFNSLENAQAYREDYETRVQAKQDVFEYIKVFYNWSPRHSALGYRSPAQHYVPASRRES